MLRVAVLLAGGAWEKVSPQCDHLQQFGCIAILRGCDAPTAYSLGYGVPLLGGRRCAIRIQAVHALKEVVDWQPGSGTEHSLSQTT